MVPQTQSRSYDFQLLENVFCDLEDDDSELVQYLNQVHFQVILKELPIPERKIFLILCDADTMTESAEMYAKTHIIDYESKVLTAITSAIDELVT